MQAPRKHLATVVQFPAPRRPDRDLNRKNKPGFTPLEIAAGIQRGMNFVFSTGTAVAIRGLMNRAGVTLPQPHSAEPRGRAAQQTTIAQTAAAKKRWTQPGTPAPHARDHGPNFMRR
jgi:hypothetical protein